VPERTGSTNQGALLVNKDKVKYWLYGYLTAVIMYTTVFVLVIAEII